MTTTRCVLLIAGAAAVAAGPLGHRSGLLPVNAALALLVVGLLLSLGGLAVVGLAVLRSGLQQIDARTAAVLALAAAASGVPLIMILPAIGAPPIHDITTDTADPPRFDAVVALRGDASNPLDYRGAELAETQQAAYPDIVSLQVGRPPREVLALAERAAADLGWKIVAVDPGGGRLEATDTTYWFGFKDDIAVRLRPAGGGATRVDVRSISRVGVGDLGANAARIRRFLDLLRAAAG